LDRGVDPLKVLRVACLNPVCHYKIGVGLLRKGDPADFIEVDNLQDFTILRTYVDGEVVAEAGRSLIPRSGPKIVNNFSAGKKGAKQFCLPARKGSIRLIEVMEDQIVTGAGSAAPKVVDGHVVSDVERDILKMAVVTRYGEAPPAVAFVRNFGLQRGAIASSVAHDAHNIIAVGAGDEEICRAVNLVIENKGGISAVTQNEETILPLPIAGLMSDGDAHEVASCYARLNRAARSMGSPLRAPFMTLSFLALTVIPHLKLSDRGLFDSGGFRFVDVFEGP